MQHPGAMPHQVERFAAQIRQPQGALRRRANIPPVNVLPVDARLLPVVLVTQVSASVI